MIPRQALVYQETLHLIEGENSQGQDQSHNRDHSPRGQRPAAHAFGGESSSSNSRLIPMPLRPTDPKGSSSLHRHVNSSTSSSSSNLRLDAVSLKAIAKVIDNKLEDRDDRLLGQVKAMLTHVKADGFAKSPPLTNGKREGSGAATNFFSQSASVATQSLPSLLTGGYYQDKSPRDAAPLRGSKPISSPRRHQPHNPHAAKNASNFLDPGHSKPRWLGISQLSNHLPEERSNLRQNLVVGVPSTVTSVTDDHHSSPVRRRDDSEGGIRYPQCRSIVYRPTLFTLNDEGVVGDSAVDGNGASSSGAASTDDVVESSSPQCTLALRHVHAYNGDVTRHGGAVRGKNIMFLGNKKVIFPAAALVIVMDIECNEQGYFCGHSEDVTCVTVHPDRTIAASGQMGKDGRLLVWDPALIAPGTKHFSASVELFMGAGIRGVCGINFSGDGRFLVSLGMDESHSMVVFDWAVAQAVASVKMGHTDVYQMGFNPYLFAATDRIDELKLPARSSPVSQHIGDNYETESCCYTLISTGGRQVKFWTLRRKLEYSDDSLVGSVVGGFKGRKIALPKTKQAFSVKYVLEGNAGAFPKQKQDTPEFLCFSVVCDEEGGTGSNRYCPPKARIFVGSSNGSVYIWQHLEDGEANRSMRTLTDFSWLPRGRLLSVITDVHDSPLVDIDYTGAYYATRETESVDGPEGEERVSAIDPQLGERIVTCSKDGIANVWRIERHIEHHGGSGPSSGLDRTLPIEHIATINVGYSEANVGTPRCIAWDLDGRNVIVGTTGNALLYLSGEGLLGTIPIRGDELQPHIFVTPIIRGHYGKIRRVAAHPTEPIFATASSDRTIRLWNNVVKAQLSLTKLTDSASSLAFTPDGKALAVGTETGELLVISFGALLHTTTLPVSDLGVSFDDVNGVHNNEKQWQVLLRKQVVAKITAGEDECSVGSATNSGPGVGIASKGSGNSIRKRCEITELKFSPSGDIIAVACRDNLIHLLSVAYGYQRRAICRGHTSYVKNVDFSADGSVLQSSDAVRELLYWEVATGKKIHQPSRLRDCFWATWTCCYGWPVQGIFNGLQGTVIDHDMNAVSRSRDGSLIVAGGSSTVNSAVKLLRFPCVGKAIPSLHGGHTSPVLDVCFLSDDSNVVSVGGNDASVFVWTLIPKVR